MPVWQEMLRQLRQLFNNASNKIMFMTLQYEKNRRRGISFFQLLIEENCRKLVLRGAFECSFPIYFTDNDFFSPCVRLWTLSSVFPFTGFQNILCNSTIFCIRERLQSDYKYTSSIAIRFVNIFWNERKLETLHLFWFVFHEWKTVKIQVSFLCLYNSMSHYNV